MKIFRARTSLFDRMFSYLTRRSSFERMFIWVLAVVCVVAGATWLWQTGHTLQQTVPTADGELHEGVIGVPRFINPVLATTRADQTVSALLFRGIYTLGPDGALVNDLADAVTISDDRTTYNITLKQGQYWHDGVEITAEDVVYTIGLIQNPELRSPLRGNWNGVSVTQIDTYELSLELEEAYVPFQENLTVGILPRHLFTNTTPDEFPFSPYNTEPVGSGLFTIGDIARTNDGLIESYTLERFDAYQPTPTIARVVVHFFADEAALLDALERGDITHTAGLSPERVATLGDRYNVYEAALPRVFALYPNQNRNPVLRDTAARQALSQAIDREMLVEQVLAGYGHPITGPLPAGFAEKARSTSTASSTPSTLLLAGGWEQTPAGGWSKEIDETDTALAVTITTVNSPLFESIAEFVAAAWKDIGIDVTVAYYEQTDLVQAVIRPRDYELLLFGTDIGRALDYYPFWHSSQREDPGLNIALYTNIDADEVLETYRITPEPAARSALLADFVREIGREAPAVFLFNPSFTYVTTRDTPLTIPERLGRPSDRFATIASWHIKSESLWPTFITENN